MRVGASTRRRRKSVQATERTRSQTAARAGESAVVRPSTRSPTSPSKAMPAGPAPPRRTGRAAACAPCAAVTGGRSSRCPAAPASAAGRGAASGPKRQTTNHAAVAKRGWRVSDESTSTTSAAGTTVPSDESTTRPATGAVCTSVSNEGENRIGERVEQERGQQRHRRQQRDEDARLADDVVEARDRAREVDRGTRACAGRWRRAAAPRWPRRAPPSTAGRRSRSSRTPSTRPPSGIVAGSGPRGAGRRARARAPRARGRRRACSGRSPGR